MSISEYAERQREAGSCIPSFKSEVTRCSKFGVYFGVPFGIYLGYRAHPRAFKPFLGTSIMGALSTIVTFTSVGIVIASYNCLKVVK